jgi:hypothetical protein
MTIRIEKETQKLKTKIRLSGRLQRKTVSSSPIAGPTQEWMCREKYGEE